jgi:16S rRNA G527 N7-methylase RsmG
VSSKPKDTTVGFPTIIAAMKQEIKVDGLDSTKARASFLVMTTSQIMMRLK